MYSTFPISHCTIWGLTHCQPNNYRCTKRFFVHKHRRLRSGLDLGWQPRMHEVVLQCTKNGSAHRKRTSSNNSVNKQNTRLVHNKCPAMDRRIRTDNQECTELHNKKHFESTERYACAWKFARIGSGLALQNARSLGCACAQKTALPTGNAQLAKRS